MEQEFPGRYAQSVPINHYEKLLDFDFRHQVASEFQKMLAEGYSEELEVVLSQFALNLKKQAHSHLIDLTAQQHSTTNFSLAENTLRGCLVYMLLRELPMIDRIFEVEIGDWEKQQIYTVNLPYLVAVLQMLYEQENKLPCILHTQNIRNKFNETFGERL